MSDPRHEADNITPPRHLTNSSVNGGGNYIPTWTDTRPGSQNHEDVPSRRSARPTPKYWRPARDQTALCVAATCAQTCTDLPRLRLWWKTAK
jgi:hypothetical protein